MTMFQLIITAVLMADPLSALADELDRRHDAALAQDAPSVPESPTTPARFEPSPAVVTPQPPDDVTPSSPGVQTLRERIRAYRDSGGQRWYEEIGGRLSDTSKAHLNLEHKWTAADVHGLTKDELNLLHGASHTGRIVAGKTATIVAVSENPPTDPAVPYKARDGRWWWLEGRMRWHISVKPVEGRQYGDWRMTGGRMERVEKIKPVIPQQSGYWTYQQQCVGGQCQMVPVWIPNR